MLTRRAHWFFVGAAILSAITFMVHVFVGGRETVSPLMQAQELDPTAKYTLYYCWHLVSIAICGMSLAFGVLTRFKNTALAWFAIGGAILYAAWDILMVLTHGLSLMIHSQWISFMLIAALGILGMLGRGNEAV